MLYLFLFTFFSPPLSFTVVAASISHFSHRRSQIFLLFFQRNWSSLFFISRSSSFFVIHVNADIKSKSKERIGFIVVVVFFFISKSPGSYAIYRRNARVLELHNFTPPYITGWTDGTILSEPKFLGYIDNQIFLPMVLSCARELRFKFSREEK